MAAKKRKIAELEAAVSVGVSILEEAQQAWPTIYDGFRGILPDTLKEKFAVEDETFAVFDFALAIMSLETGALRNLYSPEQAERLRTFALNCIDSPEYGEYAKEEIEEYTRVFEEAIKDEENPIHAVSARLLHRWLGDAIGEFEVEIRGKKTGFISPVLVDLTTMCLVERSGHWKTVKDAFELVPHDTD